MLGVETKSNSSDSLFMERINSKDASTHFPWGLSQKGVEQRRRRSRDFISAKSDQSKDFNLDFRLSDTKESNINDDDEEDLEGLVHYEYYPWVDIPFKVDLPRLCPFSECGKRPRYEAEPMDDSNLCTLKKTEGLGKEKMPSIPQLHNRHRLSKKPLLNILDQHRLILKKITEHVTEGAGPAEKGALLNMVYTELYITDGLKEEVCTQQEVMQLETALNTHRLHESPIRNQDIFKALPDRPEPLRVALTCGVAGAGKSFAVQKFTLDWAEGLENQDIDAVIPLSFKELNLFRKERHSLLSLIHCIHLGLRTVSARQLSDFKLLVILEGLDECRFPLDFHSSVVVSNVTEKAPVGVLLANLIKGHLLPSALVWITSRPAAANQIPMSCVDRLTEVRGFTVSQKEDYFRKRFRNKQLSGKIISHIRRCKSLDAMCKIPVFCWVLAVVLEDVMIAWPKEKLPTTLTDIYSCFMMVQLQRKKIKYQQWHEAGSQELMKTDWEVLLRLGQLAFQHLEKGNTIFYQEDLQQCGLDVTEASVYSGVCTEIFKRDWGIFRRPLYCFVHLSVQEFLAAVYVMRCFVDTNTEALEDFLEGHVTFSSVDEFLQRVTEKSLRSENGHLDLLVRFLHGLCVESNHRLLGGLLGTLESAPSTKRKIITNLKSIQRPPLRRSNIHHCLMELKDH